MEIGNELPLERCPHCSVNKPRIVVRSGSRIETRDAEDRNFRAWYMYECVSCGGVILAMTRQPYSGEIIQMWPEGDTLAKDIPPPARSFLRQAIESLHAPALAQIGASRSVESMLKAKGYTDEALAKRGERNPKLFHRINAALEDHLITPEMASWAHEVRLDANEQRHVDEKFPDPSKEEAEKTIKFAKALAEYLFVLPAMVSRGREVMPVAKGQDAEVTPSRIR